MLLLVWMKPNCKLRASHHSPGLSFLNGPADVQEAPELKQRIEAWIAERMAAARMCRAFNHSLFDSFIRSNYEHLYCSNRGGPIECSSGAIVLTRYRALVTRFGQFHSNGSR